MADPTHLDAAERRVMEHLVEALGGEKPENVVVFSRDEAEILVEWAKFMIAWRTLARWAPGAKQVILWFGGALAFYLTFRDFIEAWIRGLVK